MYVYMCVYLYETKKNSTDPLVLGYLFEDMLQEI